ncbi:MAG: gliding motility-associated ABC transporter substrate-binding protein GldG [Cyclobacteriaceae bacterium]|nr:gliding motility-associated ABC transporter substrate-binding protein GldG [Cyclobacteriaceae bacterium]
MVNLESKRLNSILTLLVGVMGIVLINQLMSHVIYRIDLTEEKRYTISEASRNLLENLEDVVYVEVYLEGELPAGVKRLQKSVRETLEEFKVYAGPNLQFRFIDPSTAKSQKARNEYYETLINKGIQATNLYDNVDGKQTQVLIFPGALISYGDKEAGITFLKGNKASTPQEQLNQSVEGVEFELANTIKMLTQPRSPKVAILHGHDELDTMHNAGVVSALMTKFQVFHVNLSTRPSLLGFDAIVLAQPKTAFSETDKYKIDQFVMHGGKAVFLVDALYANMDSAGSENNLALPYETNLDDLFFKYGFRINRDLVLDMNAGPYPVVVGNVGENPQVRLLPWPFFPLVNDFTKHPAVRNLDAVITRFVSTIDTTKAEGIVKIPLMKTSQYSKVMHSPVRVSINELKKDMKPDFFDSGPQTIAWIFEGKFTSLYKNRFLPEGADSTGFLPDGVATKMLIVSDGDIAANDVNPKTGQPFELGFDPFTETKYANADFLVNALTYLIEEDGIIQTRAREIKIRPLDAVKVKNERVTWQIVNLMLPIAVIIVFGLIKFFIRKRRYTRFGS